MVSIASIRARASSTFRTGVLPFFWVCFGPRTVCAGLTGMTWPTTIQSKSIRRAARRSFTVGLEWSLSCASTNAATWIGSTWARSTIPCSAQKPENCRNASR